MKLASPYLALLLILAIGCTKQESSESGGRDSNAQRDVATRSTSEDSPAVPGPPSAAEILEQVSATYASITNYTATGQTISEMDLAGADFSKLPGMPPNTANSPEFKRAMEGKQTTRHTFTVKLARPDHYLIEWEGGMAPRMPGMKGAVWSDGSSHYLMLGQNRYSKMPSRDMALGAATGVSGGAAHLIPALFFVSDLNPLKHLLEAVRQPDEMLDQEKCYVLEASMAGMKVRYWIAQESHFIKQQQQIMGGKVETPKLSEDDLRQTLEMMNQEATPEKIEQMRRTMDGARDMMSNVKGSITQAQKDIQVNQPLAADKLVFKLPAEAQIVDFPLPQF